MKNAAEKLLLTERFTNEQSLSFSQGETIFHEGDTGRELYIIQNGSVRIQKETDGGKLDLVTFHKGEFFGEMALLQSVPRYASAIALEDNTRLLILQPAAFLVKIRRDPTLAFEMLQQLSFRLKKSVEGMLGAVSRTGQSTEEIQEMLDTVNQGEDL